MENFYSRTIFITCSLRMFFFNFIFSSSQYFFQIFTFPQILFIHTSRHIYSSLPFQSLRYSHKIVILVKLITYTFLFFIYSGYSYTFCHFVFPEHFQLSIWIFNHSILWIIQKTRYIVHAQSIRQIEQFHSGVFVESSIWSTCWSRYFPIGNLFPIINVLMAFA